MPLKFIYRLTGAQTGLISQLSLLLALIFAPVTANQAAEVGINASDSRRVYSEGSPDWLRAVGKLQIPGIKIEQGRRRAHLEACSATLVSKTHSPSSDIIITAWHCLEYYRDLSKPITFTLLPASGEPISSEAYRLTDGGDIHSDWAILKLSRAVSSDQVSSLHINPGSAVENRPIIMAGYSADADKGQSGNHLTYDPACSFTVNSSHSNNSNCLAHKGASGGAVVQLSEQGQAWFSGVISQGDGNSTSTFVPVAGFRSAINRHLR
jgi:hypothetical protein